MTRRSIMLLGVLALVVLLAWFVWPTPYEYEDTNLGVGMYSATKKRTHRFTGRVELYMNGAWKQAKREGNIHIVTP